PRECVAPSTAHTDKGRLLGEPMSFREKGVPGIPRPARIGLDEADVKTALEQFNLSLWLVVKVAASPGPRLPTGCLLRNDHDAAQLALRLAIDPSSFIRGSFGRLDGQRRIVHQEVEAIEPMPGSLLAGESRGCPAFSCADRTGLRGAFGMSTVCDR